MTKKERLEYLKNWNKLKTEDDVESYIEQLECDVEDEAFSDNDSSEDLGYSQSYIDDINTYFKGDS